MRLTPNPDHQRANLVIPTDIGARAYAAAAERQAAWAKAVTRGLDGPAMTDAGRVLQSVLAQLQADDEIQRAETRS